MNIIDLFCGTGGLSYGVTLAIKEARVVYGIDILSDATQTFKLNHAEAITDTQDIRKIKLDDLARRLGKNKTIDLIVGAPPCQGFSSIRPFRGSGIDDPRNSLFEQFVNFINFFRPTTFIFENVVGLATYNDGATLSSIIDTFSAIGYQCDWRILNAAFYGVPQKRERLFILGSRQKNVIWPSPTHYCPSPTIGYRDPSKVIRPQLEPLIWAPTPETLIPAISTYDAISDLPPIASGEESDVYATKPQNEYQSEMRKGNTHLRLHSATAHSQKMLEIIKHSGPNISCIPKHLITSGFSSCYSRLTKNEPSVTLTVNFVHPASNRCIHPTLNRALTPREGARIQSFPDHFLFYGSRTSIVKQIGNAVPPFFSKAIAEQFFQKDNKIKKNKSTH